MKILLFIESLRAGGKERRFVEFLKYLKQSKEYELLVVLMSQEIQYPDFFLLDIQYKIIERKQWRKDPRPFFSFYKICTNYKPDCIHTWGNMSTFYALPAVIIKRFFLINSEIVNAPPNINWWSFGHMISTINFTFSNIITSNSKAGLLSHRPPLKKSLVIYNGIDHNRFNNLKPIDTIKKKYKIITNYVVIMIGSFNQFKDYEFFSEVAHFLTSIRNDISFIGVGDSSPNLVLFNKLSSLSESNPHIIFYGRINDVESLISACDIGVLFSPLGEGISNAIMEYMSLKKPVIANDIGGTRELIKDTVSGYLVKNKSVTEVASHITRLIDNEEIRVSFGKEGRKIIEDFYSLKKMGEAFTKLYDNKSIS